MVIRFSFLLRSSYPKSPSPPRAAVIAAMCDVTLPELIRLHASTSTLSMEMLRTKLLALVHAYPVNEQFKYKKDANAPFSWPKESEENLKDNILEKLCAENNDRNGKEEEWVPTREEHMMFLTRLGVCLDAEVAGDGAEAVKDAEEVLRAVEDVQLVEELKWVLKCVRRVGKVRNMKILRKKVEELDEWKEGKGGEKGKAVAHAVLNGWGGTAAGLLPSLVYAMELMEFKTKVGKSNKADDGDEVDDEEDGGAGGGLEKGGGMKYEEPLF